MAKERVRNFRHRGKADMGNDRMRNPGYLSRWLVDQGARTDLGVEGVVNLLSQGYTFENVEAIPTPEPEPEPEPEV